MKPNTVFLLDAMALIYRAHYAVNKTPRINSKGLNTSAILGFANTVYDVIKNEKPSHIAVAFDSHGPTVRHTEYEAYKANREETPPEIIAALPYIKRLLEAFNIPVLILGGYEADDIIGTLAKQAETEGFNVMMMTSDKDYGQLVSEKIKIYKPARFGNGVEILGVQEVCTKYGLKMPEQLIDILGLWGDSSDNIPGVPQIGEAKAKKLIAEFGSIEAIYDRIDEVTETRTKANLLEFKAQAFLSKKLATIILDVPVSFDEEAFRSENPNPEAMKELLADLEFRQFAARLSTDFKWSEFVPKSSEKPISGFDLFSVLEESEGTQQPASTKCVEQISELPELQTVSKIYFELFEKEEFFVFSTDEHQKYILNLKLSEFSNYAKTLIENPDIQKITYDLKSKYLYFKSLNRNFNGSVFDLQLADYIIQPELSHRLELLAQRYLSEYTIRPFEQVLVFARLMPVIEKELIACNGQNLLKEIEQPLAEVLADMEYEGVHFNTQILTDYKSDMDKDLLALENEIFTLAGTSFNLASPKQLGEILFLRLKIIENAKLTKTKQFQTGEEVLSKLEGKHPIIGLILQHRQLSKLKSTYVDALPQLINLKTGRIHTHFNQVVTATGRLSSSQPNLQNIPIRTERGREIRKAFVGRDENSVIISADYSQIELRIMAEMSGDESMLKAFQNHIDIHAATAAKIFKVPVEQVTSEMRRTAKTVNFGIIYGISSFGLADRLHIKPNEARTLISDYFQNFPKVKLFMEECVKKAQTAGYVETLFGRRRYIKDILSPNSISRSAAERTAINAPIQGTAADLIKVAMLHVFKTLKDKNVKSKMILQVHDELVFDVPQDEINLIMDIVPHEMTQLIRLNVPLEVDIHYGKNWHEAH